MEICRCSVAHTSRNISDKKVEGLMNGLIKISLITQSICLGWKLYLSILTKSSYSTPVFIQLLSFIHLSYLLYHIQGHRRADAYCSYYLQDRPCSPIDVTKISGQIKYNSTAEKHIFFYIFLVHSYFFKFCHMIYHKIMVRHRYLFHSVERYLQYVELTKSNFCMCCDTNVEHWHP